MTKPKYELGDKVYFITSDYNCTKVPCHFCDAEGEVFTKNNQTKKCPVCEGKIMSSKWQTIYSVSDNKTIVAIFYANEKNEANGILYSLSGSGYADFTEEAIFVDFDVTDAEAKKRNELEQ